jgi:alpha-glucoside transport system permease protein
VDLVGGRWAERIRPYVFLGPAVAMLTVFLVAPAVLTIIASAT